MRVFLAICFISAGSLTGAREFIGGSFGGDGLRGHWSAGVEDVGPHGAPGFSARFRGSLEGLFRILEETGPIRAGFDYGWNSNAGSYPYRRAALYPRYGPWGGHGLYHDYVFEASAYPQHRGYGTPWVGAYRNGNGYGGYPSYPYGSGYGYNYAPVWPGNFNGWRGVTGVRRPAGFPAGPEVGRTPGARVAASASGSASS
ncbi:uncharacterized protein LOC119462713 isoform X2 [Dermacentor silvarum]|uniref:uncharacterized protein LOC119462713 isoform X2 n=1 Tax=Dermacentor silvarum TaxID=543639 RepID=UPI0021006EF1|nr:uncharacterized protein LOC119462713 isoform X2 [Dermacentor silvarum]